MEQIVDVLVRRYPQFNTIVSSCLVSDALYQMTAENSDYLIVMDDERFQGIVTDHDIASKILFEDRPLNKIPVTEFMNKTLPISTPDASLEQTMQLMDRYHVKHLAIFDRFHFLGVVSLNDLMKEQLNRHSQVFDEADNKRQGYPWNY